MHNWFAKSEYHDQFIIMIIYFNILYVCKTKTTHVGIMSFKISQNVYQNVTYINKNTQKLIKIKLFDTSCISL